MKRIRLNRKSKSDIGKLKSELDRIFSLYIRQRDKGVCFTCGKQDDIKHMDCGHYTPRSHLNTRWNEINCACQCKGCNIFKKGNMDVFAIRLQEKYGLQILKWLDELKKEDKGMRYGKSWYEEEIAKYKKLVAEIS